MNKVFFVSLGLLFILGCRPPVSEVEQVSSAPHIDPDYTDLLIPPNMAPLNFKIKEEGKFFSAIFSCENESFEIHSKNGLVQIPIKKWRHFLSSCKGDSFSIDILANVEGQKWQQFSSIVNRVSQQPIDSHVAYRLINPGYVLWWELGIYQRDITTFDEKPIFTNRVTKHNCMNCHSFCQNDPNRMMFHMRSEYGGTMLIYDDKVEKVDTKTDYTMSAGVYPSWNPDGRHIAYSVNKIYQKFHAYRDKNQYVYDVYSDLIIYDIDKKQVTTSPQVSTKRMENLPNWHPNGRDLYFISADPLDSEAKYESVKYDLMHTTFDVESNEWGEVDPVLTVAQLGKSITFPKVSPNGRFLMFTASDYGYFTIHNTSSDLWLFDLREKSYSKLDVNSNHVDSYHSWSSDGNWFVFTSKRRDQLCGRLYFSYVDENGQATKPFLMPQKDPAFYDTFLLNYNVPEMIKGPVTVSSWDIEEKALLDPTPVSFDSTVQIDALSGASKIQDNASKPYL